MINTGRILSFEKSKLSKVSDTVLQENLKPSFKNGTNHDRYYFLNVDALIRVSPQKAFEGETLGILLNLAKRFGYDHIMIIK